MTVKDGGQSKLLTIGELAARLEVTVRCIRGWRVRGVGPPAIRVGTALRWDPREVDAWLDSQRESRLSSGSSGLVGDRLQ